MHLGLMSRARRGRCGWPSRHHLLLVLFSLLLLAFLRISLQPDSQADHEHLLALTSREPAVQPLIRRYRSIVVLQLEPRFTQNMHTEFHGVDHPTVHATVQVHKGDRWLRVGTPWELKVSNEYWQWAVYQRHHPGKGLEDFNWHEHTFDLGKLGVVGDARLSLTTNIPKPISMLVHVHEMSFLGRHRSQIAMLIAVLVFGLIAFEVTHRTVAAALGTCLVLGTMACLGERPTVHQMAGWLDVDTLLLLFGMMVLVAYLSLTGVFGESSTGPRTRAIHSPPRPFPSPQPPPSSAQSGSLRASSPPPAASLGGCSPASPPRRRSSQPSSTTSPPSCS